MVLIEQSGLKVLILSFYFRTEQQVMKLCKGQTSQCLWAANLFDSVHKNL